MENFDKRDIDARLAEGFPFTDRRHNRFHLEMPFGLINDPNGLAYHNGWHIFYQWNPFGTHEDTCLLYLQRAPARPVAERRT